MKENKSSFIIIRVTLKEKENLLKSAKLAGVKKFTRYIRKLLGLDK